MLNLNLNIIGAGQRSRIGAGGQILPTTTTTTTTTSTTTTSTTTTTAAPATFRTDPNSGSLLFATPGNQFVTLGMSSSYSDVHADIAPGIGANYAVNTGSFADASYTNFASDGYVTSTRVQNSGSFYNQNNPDFNFNTNFTFETWVYGLGEGSSKTFYSDYAPGEVLNSSIWLQKEALDRLRFIFVAGVTPGEFIVQTGGLSWNPNVWYHIAFVKNGNNYTIYRNGVNVASGVVSGPINTTTQRKRIMGYRNLPEETVWVQDYRIYKGTAVYNSNFTPPPSMVIG